MHVFVVILQPVKNPHRVIGIRTHEPNILLRRILFTKVMKIEVIQ